jgi:hypothetical protein
MEDVLKGYQVDQPTWICLSFFLILAVYFRFSRILSLRNGDLALLLAISPGILLAHPHSDSSTQNPTSGYVWLFVVSGVLLVRLVADGYFTRRPRLEQNLNTQGLTFLGIVAFVFLSATAWNERLPDSTMQMVEDAARMINRQEAPSRPLDQSPRPSDDAKAGPTAPLLAAPFVKIPELMNHPSKAPPSSRDYAVYAARLTSMVAHLAVVIALVCIGWWHFADRQVGIAMAALYLLLPCTSYDVARVNHVLPAALILWAIAAYRKPAVAGGLMGLACGSLFFPVFLLPLWFAFYDRRGAVRFGIALAAVGTLLVGSFVLTSVDIASFRDQILGAIDFRVLWLRDSDVGGFWRPDTAAYRIPVFVAFCVMTTILSIWPRRKSFDQLIAHSTAIIVGTQFWYPQQGSVYTLWYLPLLLVVVFRPPLSHLLPPAMTLKEKMEQSNGAPNSRELVGM